MNNNIRFIDITFKNFRSYTEETYFKFNNEFNFIFGENRAGKSSIFRAMTWCLEGTDSEGIKGNNLKSWSGRGACWVRLTFSIKNTKHVLYRQYGPNKLQLDDEDIDQDRINALFGFNVKLFGYITFMSQFSDQFINAAPADKLKLFTTILELESWDDNSLKAKNKVVEIDEKINDTQYKLKNLEGRIDGLVSQNYDKEIKEFDLSLKNQIKELMENNVKLQENNIKIKQKLQKLTKEYNEKRDEHDSFEDNNDKYAKIIDEINEISYEIRDFNKDIQKYETFDLETIKRKILDDYAIHKNKLQNTTGNKCITCKQTIGKEHIDKQVKILEENTDEQVLQIEIEMDDFVKKINNIVEKRKVKSEFIKNLQKEKEKLEENREIIEHLENELGEKQQVISDLKFRQKEIDRDITQNEREITKLQVKENPYIEKNKQLLQQLRDVKEQIEDTTENLENTEIEKGQYEYWITAFKEIKLLITQESLREFNFYCDSNLEKLGLLGWSIENSIDKPLKKGGVRRGFHTLIKTPENDKESPLSVYCGGEQQRLKLSMIFALIDFLNSRISTNIEIYDEPTQWLNAAGVEALLEILEERTSKKGVYLIDNRDFRDKGIFDNVYEIDKDEKGSKIKELVV